jgi:LysM repeat protein
MTRENKLVMVIGFGLLLFVGILVSDHLAARDSQIASPATIVSYESRALPGGEELRVLDFGSAPERAADEPAQVDGRRVVLADPLPEMPGFGGTGGLQQPQQPIVPPAAPAERIHTIAKGDNPEKIAQKYYGKRSLAAKLAEYNGIDPTKLKIGQTLKVPDIAVLDPNAAAGHAPMQPAVAEAVQQPPVERGSQERGSTERASAERSTPPAAAKTSVTTVRKGDNLWKIAERVYGKSSTANVERLRALNPSLNDKNLKVGAQIKIAAAN